MREIEMERPRKVEKRPLPTRTLEAEVPMPVPVEAPTLQQQLDNPAGILEVWLHETNLKEGMTYCYRLRLILLNPLLGRFRDAADEKDAKVLTLKTPWSDWSEPVDAKRSTEFFLVGHAPQSEMVVVDVFSSRWGQRVRHRFNVSRGEPIGANVTKELPRLGGDGLQRDVVSFSTGTVAVDFDFSRKQRIPNTNFLRTTTELLYLDADGRLRTRTEFQDVASQRYRELLNEARQASGPP